jgi:sugar phosphate permease
VAAGRSGRKRVRGRAGTPSSHYMDRYCQNVSTSEAAVRAGGRPGRRWLVLAAGTVAVTAGSAFQYGLAYLIPALRAAGLPLAQAGVLVACPTVGLLLTLIAWGAAADRWGERRVLAIGLSAAGLVLLAATRARGMVMLGACLVLAGAAGASVYAASGRLILGWFAARERGLAMGIRQSSQPLGVAVAALTLPSLAARGLASALIFLGGFCLAAAVLVVVVVRDPAREGAEARPARGSPYRTGVLWRIHAASALLVVPQFTVATFALVFLVDTRGWHAAAAGSLLAVAAVAGGASRLAAGYWSDRVGSRMGPMRILALATTAVLLALALTAVSAPALAVPVLLAAAVLVVSTNGLAFTAVAEYAGPAWAGRALGVQNTGQNALAALTPPVAALLIAAAGYPAAFAAAGVLPLAAAALVPLAAERAAARRAPPTEPAPGAAAAPLPAARPDPAPAGRPAPAPRSQPPERPPPARGIRRARGRRTPAATNAAGSAGRRWPRKAGRPRPGDRSRPGEPGSDGAGR